MSTALPFSSHPGFPHGQEAFSGSGKAFPSTPEASLHISEALFNVIKSSGVAKTTLIILEKA